MKGTGSRKSILNAPPQTDRPTSLYVHVPFCQSRCRYCDFCSAVYEPALAGRTVGALLAELQSRKRVLHVPLRTLFVGGGTPTVLADADLARLLGAMAPLAGPEAEFTVEANPGTLSPATLETLRRAGVNRLSLGVQSLNDAELAVLGRIHTASQAERAVGQARESGFTNLSLDLIYGVPTQTLASWRASLERAMGMGCDHLSAYCLSVEPGTALEADLRAGRLEPMDEELQRDCYELLIEVTRQAGLEHYEISNFARPHRRCAHNLVYWHNQPYLGIGPSAVSYVGGVRVANSGDLAEYLAHVEAGRDPASATETITGRQQMAETLMLELRLREGVARDAFARRFGADPVEAFAEPITRYAALGLLEVTPERMRLAESALFVADAVLADIIAAV